MITNIGNIPPDVISIESTPFFVTVCREWNVQPLTNREYDSFQIHFRQAKKEHTYQTPIATKGRVGLGIVKLQLYLFKYMIDT